MNLNKIKLDVGALRRVAKKNYTVSILLAVLVFAAAIALSIKFKPYEMFINSYPLNTYHTDPQMVNFEMNNKAFMVLFQKTFGDAPCTLAELRADVVALPVRNEAEEKDLITWFRLQMQQIHANYQVVQWEVTRVLSRKSDPAVRVYEWDAVVYRLPAYHGKHLRMVTEVGPKGSYKMVAARLMGEVPSEQIQLAPVISYDPEAKLYAENDSTLTSFALPAFSSEEINQLVSRQQEKIKFV